MNIPVINCSAMLSLRLSRYSFSRRRFYSYLHQVGEHSFEYNTIGKMFERSARKFGEREAIISCHQNKKLTYEDALIKCDKLAAGLINSGLQKGDRVGIWLPNMIEWFLTKFACARAGLTLVALNPSYQVPELEYSINKVGIKCLVCPDKIKNICFYDMIKELIPDLSQFKSGNIKSKRTPSLQSIIMISEDALSGIYNYEDIAECKDQSLIENIKRNQDSIKPDSVYSMLFSSGTTGKPKAAMVSHFSQINNSSNIGRRFELDVNKHKICVMVPMFHGFGLTGSTITSVSYGSTIVLPSPTYNSVDNLTSIVKEKCTMVHGTPTMHLDLISEQQKRKEDICLEVAVTAGAAISLHQINTMLEVFKLRIVKNMYGLTETTCMLFSSKPGEDMEKSSKTVGCLSDHTEAKVVDKRGNIVPFGTPGELCVRGYQNMMGYCDDDEKTQATLGFDGWLKTGDQFILTEDGYGKIVGRNKDIIIRGGENIFPKEVEDVLITHPNIAEVSVVGLPHARLGEQVCACVRLNEKTQLTLQELVEFCKGKMAHFKIPSEMKILEELPKTATGKIQKYMLVKQFSGNVSCN